MRIWWVLLLVMPVAAHTDHGLLPDGSFIEHVDRQEFSLDAGAATNYTLAFGGLPFGADWWWLLRADVTGNVTANLTAEGSPLASWDLGPGSHTRFVRLPEAGVMDLAFVAQDNATVAFYYDQTCDCIGKQVPLPSGPVWFNIDAQAGDQVTFPFIVQPTQFPASGDPLPGHVGVVIERMHEQAGALVVLERIEHNFTVNVEESCYPKVWIGCFDVQFTAPHDGMQILLVTLSHDGHPSWDTTIQPTNIQVTPPKQAPGVPLAWLLLGLGLVAWKRR